MIRATKTVRRFTEAFLSSNFEELARIWKRATKRPKLAETLRLLEEQLMSQIEAGADI